MAHAKLPFHFRRCFARASYSSSPLRGLEKGMSLAQYRWRWHTQNCRFILEGALLGPLGKTVPLHRSHDGACLRSKMSFTNDTLDYLISSSLKQAGFSPLSTSSSLISAPFTNSQVGTFSTFAIAVKRVYRRQSHPSFHAADQHLCNPAFKS